MTRSKMYMVLATCVAVAGVGYGAYAQTGAGTPPSMIPYHGYLEDAAGPIDGTRNLTFFITSAAGGNLAGALWQETRDVSFSNGYFSVALGASTPIPASTFNQATRFLRVQIDGNQLNGAQQLLATPYSITAQVANTFSVNTLAVAGAATAASVATTSGFSASGGPEADNGGVGGQLHLARGSEQMAIDTNEIKTSATLFINTSPSDANTQLGHIGGSTQVNGDLSVTGRITSLNTTSEYRVQRFSNTPAGGVNPDGITMTSAVGSMCFLTRVGFKSNNSNWNSCEIISQGGSWFLRATNSSGADADCYARCVNF